jgi:hypothetical protein
MQNFSASLREMVASLLQKNARANIFCSLAGAIVFGVVEGNYIFSLLLKC